MSVCDSLGARCVPQGHHASAYSELSARVLAAYHNWQLEHNSESRYKIFDCAQVTTLYRSAPWCRAQVPARGNVRAHAQLEAVIFDCDGVILESEDLHRRAYNAAFQNFRVECDGSPVVWSEEFYDELQNTVGGGKPKMRWYFSPDRNGWPTSSIVGDPPRTEDEQALLIDTLQVGPPRADFSGCTQHQRFHSTACALSGTCSGLLPGIKLAALTCVVPQGRTDLHSGRAQLVHLFSCGWTGRGALQAPVVWN